MTNNFLTTIKSLKLIEGCKAAQLYALSSVGASTSGSADAGVSSIGKPHVPPPPKAISMRSGSLYYPHAAPSTSGAFVPEPHLPCGLPVADALEPALDACLRPVDHVGALAASYRRVSAGGDDDLCDAYLEQHALFQSIGDARLIRRALRAARVHADNPHRRAVLAAWLRYERREDELDPAPPPLAPCTATTPLLECPRAAVFASVSHSVDLVCPCRCPPPPPITPPPHHLRRNTSGAASEMSEEEEPETNDLCSSSARRRWRASARASAALSKPLNTMLNGGFAEALHDRIDFSRDGISPRGMCTASAYSRHGRVDGFPPDIISQLLAFANKFCCEGLKAACDDQLAAMVRGLDDDRSVIDIGLPPPRRLLPAGIPAGAPQVAHPPRHRAPAVQPRGATAPRHFQ